ncbi:MAG: TetR/AcrR family transcriptional regulator [Pseudomonadota bacterium]
MPDDAHQAREDRIAKAAYDLLETRGYAGTSMLAVAKAARASNETLYNWYGDKLGLFRALIERNSQDVRALLDTQAPESAPLQTLAALGPALLTLLLGDRAIALNRAAAGDATGTLGRALAETGRDVILPRIGAVLAAARNQGDLRYDQLDEALDLYIALLVGDLQIRRVIGTLPAPDADAVRHRAETALTRFLALTAPAG